MSISFSTAYFVVDKESTQFVLSVLKAEADILYQKPSLCCLMLLSKKKKYFFLLQTTSPVLAPFPTIRKKAMRSLIGLVL
jgi:hypothetical protein